MNTPTCKRCLQYEHQLKESRFQTQSALNELTRIRNEKPVEQYDLDCQLRKIEPQGDMVNAEKAVAAVLICSLLSALIGFLIAQIV